MFYPVGLIRNGSLDYIQSDHLGTPRRVIEPGTGTIRWRWPLTSEPFGDAQPNEDPDSIGTDFEFNLRFPEQYYDAEFGLHYNYYRDYEPGTGRYVQSDPIGLEGGINTYGYAYHNPINAADPYGLKGWYCQRPLSDEPGERGPPVLNHQYLCVTTPNGTIECGSQTTDGNYFRSEGRPTRPDEDYYHEGSCEQVDDDENQCYEKCVRYNFTKLRPPYGIGPQGTDCQEWSSNTHIGCKLICAKYPDRADEYFSSKF